MNRAEIDRAIREMFPTGLLDEPRIHEPTYHRVARTVGEIEASLASQTSLRISHRPQCYSEWYFCFAATLPPAPTPDEWIFSWDNAAKLNFIAESGMAFAIWWAHFSFVYPVWEHYLNLWTPRPSDRHYLNTNWTESAPIAEWSDTLRLAERVAASFGFSRISPEQQRLTSQGVRYTVYSDDDDDDEPHYKLCTLGQCLFSEC